MEQDINFVAYLVEPIVQGYNSGKMDGWRLSGWSAILHHLGIDVAEISKKIITYLICTHNINIVRECRIIFN